MHVQYLWQSRTSFLFQDYINQDRGLLGISWVYWSYKLPVLIAKLLQVLGSLCGLCMLILFNCEGSLWGSFQLLFQAILSFLFHIFDINFFQYFAGEKGHLQRPAVTFTFIASKNRHGPHSFHWEKNQWGRRRVCLVRYCWYYLDAGNNGWWWTALYSGLLSPRKPQCFISVSVCVCI